MKKHEQTVTSVTGRTPRLGETVLFYPKPDDSVAKSNHNDDPIPAIITRVWSAICVNLKIFPDCGAVQDRTSVCHQSANPVNYNFMFIEEYYGDDEQKEQVLTEEHGGPATNVAMSPEPVSEINERRADGTVPNRAKDL